MNDLVRPTSYYTGGIAASALAGALATIPNPPPEITRLPAGTTLRGVVIGTDGKGHVLVKTDQGTLAVATKAHFPRNSEVVLQIRSSGTLLHVMIMQARNPGVAPDAPPQSAARTPGPPLGSGGTGTSQMAGSQPGFSGNLPAPAPSLGARGAAVTSPGPTDPLNLGQVVRAVVQGSASPIPATPSLQPGAQGTAAGNSAVTGAQAGPLPRPVPGTILPLRILSVSAPGPAPSVAASPTTGPAVSSTQGARAYNPSAPQGPPGTLPPTGGPATAGAPIGITLSGSAAPSLAPGATANSGLGPATAPAGSSAPSTSGLPGAGPTAAATTAPPGSIPSSAPGVAVVTATTPLSPQATPSAYRPGSGPVPNQGGSTAVPSFSTSANTAQGNAGAAGTPTASSLAAPSPGVPPAAVPSSSAIPAGPAGDALTTPLRFTGLVTSVTHAGHPVLSTPLGTLSLEVQAWLPGGSRLALELAPGALPKAAEVPMPMATVRSLAHAWPALEEALAILADTGAGAMQGTPQGVPQPGARLTSGMLFFMAALSGGNLGRWLGADALQTLRASGRDNLIGRLSRDLAQMGRMSDGTGGTGSTAGDWRLLPIPLWHGDHVHQLRLFLRQHENRRDGGKKRDPADPTRFILELEMSRLGEMQLDGLIRDKRFDLMMRTRGALPEDMRRDIRQIFEDANQAAGYSGNLGFQASADWHFLPIDQDTATGEPPGLLV